MPNFEGNRGTKTILGNRELKKTNVRFLGNRGTSKFISGEQVPPPPPLGGPNSSTDCCKAVLLLWILFVICVECSPSDNLLGKG